MKKQLLRYRQSAAASRRNILSGKMKFLIFCFSVMVFLTISIIINANGPGNSSPDPRISASVSYNIGNTSGILPQDEAKYVGSALCLHCHRGMKKGENKELAENYQLSADVFNGTAHVSTSADAGKTPGKIVAQFASDSPLQLSQINYTIGAGRSEQRYCDASFKMLPFKWNVRTKKWAPEPIVDASKECMACHATGYNVNTVKWNEPGVTCEACHGPGSLHTATGDKTKILNPKKLPYDRQAMVCGQCHSHGTDKSGGHPFPIEFRPGDDLNKVYIIEKRDKGAKYSELISSKHIENEIVCTVCHAPHGSVQGIQHQLRKPVNELCMECHTDKTLSEHAPNSPEGTTCATCHMPGGSHQFTIQLKK